MGSEVRAGEYQVWGGWRVPRGCVDVRGNLQADLLWGAAHGCVF